MAKRMRKVRSVTLSDALVERLLAWGRVEGESRLSVLLDRAMSEFLERHDASKAKPPRASRTAHSPKPKGRRAGDAGKGR